MTSTDYELIYIEAALDVLDKYILSSEIYWPVGASSPPGDPPYPRLTLGTLLVYLRSAHARDTTPNQTSRLSKVDEGIDKIRSQWRTAWDQKASKEFHSRLTLWKNFLEDYRDNAANNVDRYEYEVSRRVMLHLLKSQASLIPEEEDELLAILDRMLEAVLIPGQFIWEQELASAFPRQVYWYLYGRPESSGT